MYSIVKDFMFNLYDLDFLSMLDGVNFYNKKVAMKYHYWQTLFSTLSQFIEIRNKSEANALAKAMKELVYWRLGMVSSTSYRKFFMYKYHSNRDRILSNLKQLKKNLREHLNIKGFVKRNKKQVARKINKSQEAPASHASKVARSYIKDNILASTLLHNIEKHFGKPGLLAEREVEFSQFIPDQSGETLGTIAFDNFNEEKFIHEIAHLLHYNCNMHHYNLPSVHHDETEEVDHDKMFWKVVEIITNDFNSGDVENTLPSIVGLRPWSVDDWDLSEQVEDRSDTQETHESEGEPSTFRTPVAFETFQSGTIFDADRGPQIYEMGFENSREAFNSNVITFGYRDDNPFDDPIE